MQQRQQQNWSIETKTAFCIKGAVNARGTVKNNKMASVVEELEETTDSDGSSSLADPPELLRSYHFGCGPFRPRRLQFLGS